MSEALAPSLASAAVAAGGAPLAGLRIVENAAFVAVPLATMSLAQMGAEVIRLDPPEGGLDYRRWPLSAAGASLYWTMLNRGKRSVTLDLRTETGRMMAADLICGDVESRAAPAIFVTNLPARAPLSPEALLARRPDCIVVTLEGSSDGRSAIDYTVHSACGAAMMAGPASTGAPVSNAIPFWDVICGHRLASGILAAVLDRAQTGRGQHVALSFSDVAMESLANLGILAEAELRGHARPPDGNWVYGSFGRDFRTRCERYFMLVAVTVKQWRALVEATGIASRIAEIEAARNVSLDDEHARYAARHEIGAAIDDWAAERDLAGVEAAFAGTAVCWSPFRDTAEMLAEDPRASLQNPMFERIPHPGVEPVLTPRTPLRFSARPDLPSRPAPALGADTGDVLPGAER